MTTRMKRETESDPDYKTADVWQSNHTFVRPLPSLDVIEQFLQRGHHSGKLIVDFNRGGKTNARFIQEKEVDIIP